MRTNYHLRNVFDTQGKKIASSRNSDVLCHEHNDKKINDKMKEEFVSANVVDDSSLL